MAGQPTIQRQSILSTIIIFLGFAIGALNLIVLQPIILTTEEWGLTRVITESAILLASFATLGTNSVAAKFLPFYKTYLKPNEIDLPAKASKVFAAGLFLTLLILLLLKPQITEVFGRNNPYFVKFYYVLVYFVIFQATFLFLEIYAWYAGKTVFANALKEFLFRAFTTACLLLYWFEWISFDTFMALFGCIYLPLVVLLAWSINRAGGFPVHWKTSSVTRRLRPKMISLGGFVFLTTISNIAFVVCDTLFLAAIYNFSQAGIYAVAQYFAQVLEVPMRSMQTSAVPIIGNYWQKRNLKGLQSIYRKSSINLLVTGSGIGGLIIINLPNVVKFLPAEYGVIAIPVCILIIGRLINLGTGVNAQLIQLSKFWKFDFASTLIYSVIGIPLNFLLIRRWGMEGAAIANVIAMIVYNGVRFIFLYAKFRLQPFTPKTLWVILGAAILVAGVYLLPRFENLFVDGIIKSVIFSVIFGFAVIRFRLSHEMVALYEKWMPKLFGRLP